MKEDIVILGNSVKFNKSCIGGVTRNNWIRLVPLNGGGVNVYEQCLNREEKQCSEKFCSCNCKNFLAPKALDIIEVDIIEKVGDERNPHQTENYIFDATKPWKYRGKAKLKKLEKITREIAKREKYIFGNEYDRVSLEEAKHSLMIISARVELYLSESNKTRAKFYYNGHKYDLAVTDPNYYNNLEYVNKRAFDAFLTISLGEFFEEKQACFKLVAGILKNEGE